MALSNQTPLRPYITLAQMTPDGRLVPGRENVYQIPYNYISDFSIDYCAGGLGKVKLNLFDLEYDWLLDGLLAQTFINSGSPQINFLMTFGWQDNSIAGALSKIWANATDARRNPGTFLDRETGATRQGTLRSGYDQTRQILSRSHIVFFDTIDLQLSEVGVELNLEGKNMFSENFKLLNNSDKSYFGYPWVILKLFARDIDIDLNWTFGVKEDGSFDTNQFDTKNTQYFEKQPYMCNNKMNGDTLEELIKMIWINSVPGKVNYYIDSFYRSGDRMRPRITIFREAESLDAANFLGNYNYFTGRESSIINTVSFDIPNLVKFLGQNIKSKTVDNSSKAAPANTTAQGQGSSNPIMARDKKKWEKFFSEKDDEESKNIQTAVKMPASGKGTSYSSQDMANYENYFINTLQNFTLKATLNVLGDPGLDFKDIKMQSFLELNIYKNDGQLMDMLSGNYAVEKVSHHISQDEFITSLGLVKWRFRLEDDIKAKKGS